MPRRLLLPVLAVLAALPATAQIDPDVAFPLDVGNRWGFVDYVRDALLRWEVVGEETVGGERLALLQFNGGATCAVRTVVGEGWVYFPLVAPGSLTAPCMATVDYPAYYGGGAGGGFSVAGDRYPYPYSALADSAWFGFYDTGSTTLYDTGAYYVERGLGPVVFNRATHGSGGYYAYVYGYELTDAVIDGVPVGEPPIPDGAGPFDAYVPHAVGDRWEYEVFDVAPNGAETRTARVAWTVTATGDASIRPVPFTLAVVRQAENGAVTRSTCTVSERTFTTRTYYAASGGAAYNCDGTFPARGENEVRLSTETGAGAVPVGAQTYTLDRAAGGGGYATNAGQYSFEWDVETARGLGIYRWSRRDPTARTRGRLGYARVGGVEYGSVLVAEEAAPGAGALALSVGPNPARARATVRYTLPPGAGGRIAVVDALGREVRRLDAGAGTAEVALGTGGLAPGVYVVRLTAGTASASARLVVAR